MSTTNGSCVGWTSWLVSIKLFLGELSLQNVFHFNESKCTWSDNFFYNCPVFDYLLCLETGQIKLSFVYKGIEKFQPELEHLQKNVGLCWYHPMNKRNPLVWKSPDWTHGTWRPTPICMGNARLEVVSNIWIQSSSSCCTFRSCEVVP